MSTSYCRVRLAILKCILTQKAASKTMRINNSVFIAIILTYTMDSSASYSGSGS